MTTACRGISRWAATIVAVLTTLAAMLLLTASTSEAAQTYTVAYGSVGSDQPRNLSVRKGDVVVFRNDLPQVPVTGEIAPVEMTFGAERFSVGATPVSRTVTTSVTYSGTYTVLGLIPTTTQGGTITVAGTPPPPRPSQQPPPPNGAPAGNGTTTPGANSPGGGAPAGSGLGAGNGQVIGPRIPRGDPGYVPGGAGTAYGPHPDGSTVGGQDPVVAPNSGSGAAHKNRAIAHAGAATNGLGLIAVLGAILLLGVGIALVRTLMSGIVSQATTA